MQTASSHGVKHDYTCLYDFLILTKAISNVSSTNSVQCRPQGLLIKRYSCISVLITTTPNVCKLCAKTATQQARKVGEHTASSNLDWLKLSQVDPSDLSEGRLACVVMLSRESLKRQRPVSMGLSTVEKPGRAIVPRPKLHLWKFESKEKKSMGWSSIF